MSFTSTGSGTSKITITEVVALLALLLLALVLRFNGLELRRLRWDELAYWYFTVSGERGPQSAPLGPLMQFLWMQLSGLSTPDGSLRILPALLSGLSVVPVYFAGRTLVNARIGVMSALFVALHQASVFYGQSARPYGQFALISSLFVYVFIKALKRGKGIDWMLYSAVMAACFLTHLLTLCILLASVISWICYVLTVRHDNTVKQLAIRSLPFVVSTCIGVAIGLLWVLVQDRAVQTVLEGAYRGSFFNYLYSVSSFLSVGLYRVMAKQAVDTALIVPVCLGLCFFIAGMVALWRRSERPAAAFLFSCIAVTAVLLYFTLGKKGSWLWGRYLLHVVAPYAIVFSIGVDAAIGGVCTGVKRRFLVAFIFILAFGSLVSMRVYARAYKPPRKLIERRLEQVVKHRNVVKGLIAPDHISDYDDESARLWVYWFESLREHGVPAYSFSGRSGLFQTIDVRSRGGIEFPVRGSVVRLSPGIYALFANRDISCKQLRSRQRGINSREIKKFTPIDRRLIFCKVVFR